MKKYNKYKDSGIEWIGEIPEHWEITRIKFAFNIQKGKTPKVLIDSKKEGSNVYLSMDFLRGEPKQTFYVSNDESVILTNEDETLLLWDGSNAGEFIKSKKGVLSSTMALIQSQIIYKKFQWFFFKSFELLLKDSCNGMGIPHVDGKFFRGSEFIVPSKEEQTTIANYLDHKTTQIDSLIAKKEQFITLLQEERTAVINQAVNKGLDPKVKMKDSGIEWLGEIPEHWEVKKLKFISKICNGQDQKAVLEDNGQYPVYGSGGIFGRANSYLFDQPSVLLGRKGTIDKPQYVEEPFWTVDTSYYTKIREGFSVRLFYYLCTTINFNLYKYGSAIPSMTQGHLNEIKFSIPKTLNEQKRIATFLDIKTSEIDTLISKSHQEIDLLKEYKTALISQVVTGKVDVRNEVLK